MMSARDRRILPLGRARSAAGLLMGLICLGSPVASVHADATPSDMQIMARALSFMQKPLSGEVGVGIVFAPGNPESARDAQQVQRILGNGLRVGNLILRPVLVPISEVARARVALYFLTAGVRGEARAVAVASRARQIPCATADLAQVRQGICALGVRSQPRIEILVNRVAAQADGISFSTAFRMMITEL